MPKSSFFIRFLDGPVRLFSLHSLLAWENPSGLCSAPSTILFNQLENLYLLYQTCLISLINESCPTGKSVFPTFSLLPIYPASAATRALLIQWFSNVCTRGLPLTNLCGFLRFTLYLGWGAWYPLRTLPFPQRPAPFSLVIFFLHSEVVKVVELVGSSSLALVGPVSLIYFKMWLAISLTLGYIVLFVLSYGLA